MQQIRFNENQNAILTHQAETVKNTKTQNSILTPETINTPIIISKAHQSNQKYTQTYHHSCYSSKCDAIFCQQT